MTGIGAVGDVEFLDPGIIRGEPASRASDIWSLGATLHWALAGVGLYGDLSGAEPLAAVRTVLTTEPEISDDLDPQAGEVVLQALDPDPTHRFGSAEELAVRIAALGAAADG